MRTWPAIDIETGRLQSTSPADPTQSPDVAPDERDLLSAALIDFGVAAIDESDGDRWRVFFDDGSERDRALAALGRDFPQLVLTALDLPDEDWAARSQASLRAIRVGRIIVAPPWDRARRSDGDTRDIEIVIQPSMGFGTGHHASTRLCLAALQQIDLNGTSVVDVGTGSGVLAIAARMLGASEVLAIDDDEDAIQAARENLALNAGVRVELHPVGLERLVLTPADVIVANLTGGLLIRAADLLMELVAPSGRLIMSGFTQSEHVSVLAAFRAFRVVDTMQEDEWMCTTLQREGAFT